LARRKFFIDIVIYGSILEIDIIKSYICSNFIFILLPKKVSKEPRLHSGYLILDQTLFVSSILIFKILNLFEKSK